MKIKLAKSTEPILPPRKTPSYFPLAIKPTPISQLNALSSSQTLSTQDQIVTSENHESAVQKQNIKVKPEVQSQKSVRKESNRSRSKNNETEEINPRDQENFAITKEDKHIEQPLTQRSQQSQRSQKSAILEPSSLINNNEKYIEQRDQLTDKSTIVYNSQTEEKETIQTEEKCEECDENVALLKQTPPLPQGKRIGPIRPHILVASDHVQGSPRHLPTNESVPVSIASMIRPSSLRSVISRGHKISPDGEGSVLGSHVECGSQGHVSMFDLASMHDFESKSIGTVGTIAILESGAPGIDLSQRKSSRYSNNSSLIGPRIASYAENPGNITKEAPNPRFSVTFMKGSMRGSLRNLFKNSSQDESDTIVSSKSGKSGKSGTHPIRRSSAGPSIPNSEGEETKSSFKVPMMGMIRRSLTRLSTKRLELNYDCENHEDSVTVAPQNTGNPQPELKQMREMNPSASVATNRDQFEKVDQNLARKSPTQQTESKFSLNEAESSLSRNGKHMSVLTISEVDFMAQSQMSIVPKTNMSTLSLMHGVEEDAKRDGVNKILLHNHSWLSIQSQDGRVSGSSNIFPDAESPHLVNHTIST